MWKAGQTPAIVSAPPFDDWVDSVFRRPVTERGWWWEESQPSPWDPEGAPEHALALLTQLFRSPGAVGRFNDQELGQGLWFLFANSSSAYLDVVRESTLPERDRVLCVESIFELNRDLLAPRCGDLPEDSGPWSLNTTTCMLWDLNSALNPHPEDPVVDEACLRVMALTLDLGSAVCQLSALHGLGHWAAGYPDRVTRTIDAFLMRKGILPNVREYAAQARTGHIP